MSETTDQNAPTNSQKPQRKRYWLVLRIIDNRIQALAPSDPSEPDSEVDWTDIGGETAVWTDRETAFQTGRANGGLLVSADGIPGPHRMTAFHDAMRARREGDKAEAQDAAAVAATKAEATAAKPYKPHSALSRGGPKGPKPPANSDGSANESDDAPF